MCKVRSYFVAIYVVSWVYDTVCCTLYSCMMYDQRSVAYTNKNILFVSHVVYQSPTIRIIHEYTERYGGYNIVLDCNLCGINFD